MSIGSVTPGWSIGFLVDEDENGCQYCVLPVIAVIAGSSDAEPVDPVVMLPDGTTVRAAWVGGERAFAVSPGEDAQKAAQAHAVSRGRSVAKTRAAA